MIKLGFRQRKSIFFLDLKFGSSFVFLFKLFGLKLHLFDWSIANRCDLFIILACFAIFCVRERRRVKFDILFGWSFELISMHIPWDLLIAWCHIFWVLASGRFCLHLLRNSPGLFELFLIINLSASQRFSLFVRILGELLAFSIVRLDGDAGSAVFLALLKADIIFYEKLNELSLVILGKITKFNSLRWLSLTHIYNYHQRSNL